MEILVKLKKYAKKATSRVIELWVDQSDKKLKYLNEKGIEQIIATQTYVDVKISAIPTPNEPNLQEVLDEGNSSTTGIVINSDDGLTSSVISTTGVAGLGGDGETVMWSLSNSTGDATVNTITNNNGLIKPYQEYKAYITQTSTGSPNIVYFHTDFSLAIIATRSNTGAFNFISVGGGLFTASKTYLDISLLSFQEGTECSSNFSRSDESTVQLAITDKDGVAVDGFAAFITIQVYN